MRLLNIAFVIISALIIASCKKESPKEPVVYNGVEFYPYYATDYEDKDGNLDYIMSHYITDLHDTLLSSNQKFLKISEQTITDLHSILERYLQRMADDNKNKNFLAKNYFRQYIGYTENGNNFVYVILLKYYLEGSDSFGCPLVFTDFQSTPITKEEYGYAGHVIIDVEKKRVIECNIKEE